MHRVAALLWCLIGLVGCGGDDGRIMWTARFVSDDLADRAVAIEGAIVRGGCHADEVVWDGELVAGTDAVVPAILPAGLYGLRARARDVDCVWYALGCVFVDVPADSAVHVEVPLREASPVKECPAAICVSGECMGSGTEECNEYDDDGDGMVDEGFDLATDPMNCGLCRHACQEGYVCIAGKCGNDVVQVAAGSGHTCARRRNGEVLCWGARGDGQLGDGVTADGAPETFRSVPSVVGRPDGPSLTDGVQLDMGRDHSCAIGDVVGDAAGVVAACWGDNGCGRLGTDGSSRTEPLEVPGLGPVRQLSAGDWQSCAALADGRVSCWGDTLDRCDTGAAPEIIADLSGVAEVTAAYSHFCARAGGVVLCWGANGSGRLGDGTTTDRASPVPVLGLVDAVGISAGLAHTCALRASGQVLCWGANADGEIGDGSTTDRPGPVAVLGIDDAVEVSAGNSFTCARHRDGRVSCWGRNDVGQLGNGMSTSSATPVRVAQVTNAVSVSSGNSGTGHACAVTAFGEVYCWGYNGSGQLGDGISMPTPMSMSLTPVPVVGFP